MEIKNVYDIYAAQQKPMVAAANRRTSVENTEKDGIALAVDREKAVDSVNISAEGSFRSQLQKAEKPYAAAYTKPTSQQRIEQLKADYSGNNCPATAQQIAGAIMTSVIGVQG
jgi:hypothetical protein